MAKKIFFVLVGVVLLSFSYQIGNTSEIDVISVKKEKKIPADEVLRKLDFKKYSEKEIMEYAKNNYGKIEIYGKGVVHDWFRTIGGVFINVMIKHDMLSSDVKKRSYNVSIFTSPKNSETLLPQKGDEIEFEGTWGQPSETALMTSNIEQELKIQKYSGVVIKVLGNFKLIK